MCVIIATENSSNYRTSFPSKKASFSDNNDSTILNQIWHNCQILGFGSPNYRWLTPFSFFFLRFAASFGRWWFSNLLPHLPNLTCCGGRGRERRGKWPSVKSGWNYKIFFKRNFKLIYALNLKWNCVECFLIFKFVHLAFLNSQAFHYDFCTNHALTEYWSIVSMF